MHRRDRLASSVVEQLLGLVVRVDESVAGSIPGISVILSNPSVRLRIEKDLAVEYRDRSTFGEVVVARDIVLPLVVGVERAAGNRTVDALALSFSSRDAEMGWAAAMAVDLSPGGRLGDSFEVDQLDPPEDIADVGSIMAIMDETQADVDLGVNLGMPRDLTGDGLADSADVSGKALIMPVIVRVRWSGRQGDRELTRALYVTSY